MTYSRSAARRRLPQQAWALEPRMMFDAAAVATAAEVVAATDTAPGVAASGVEAAITIDDGSGAQSVDLFSGVSVTQDSGGESLSTLTIAVDSSGGNQALIVDGSAIALKTGSGETSGNGYYYSVAVSGGVTTLTLSLNSTDANSAADVATLIDGIAYSTLDNTVESGEVTVTLSTLSDDSDTATLGISSTIAIDSSVNVAPALTDDSALDAAESISIGDLGNDVEVVYSSDGNEAYAAGNGVVSHFSVDDSGRLTLVGTITIEGMNTAAEMVISADGDSIYLIDTLGDEQYSYGDDYIYVLSVADDGSLSHTATVSSENGGITGGLAISEDGAYVYAGTAYNDVVVFSRDSATGALTYLTRAPGEYGSNSRNGVILAAGDYVYVIYTTGSHNILVYQRNDDGSLSTVASLLTGASGYDAVDYSLAVSDDGQYLYVADPNNGAIALYRFSDGSLSLLETLTLADVSSIALSDGGGLLYATTSSGAINVYSVAGGGSLVLLSSIDTGADISDIAVSDDGLSLLVSGGGGVVRYTLAQTLEQGGALAFADGLTLSDSNYDALNNGAGNYRGASVTVSDGAAGGVFGFADGGGLSYADGVISLDGAAVATLSAGDGALTVTFTADTTTAVANQVLQQLTYANDSAAAGSYIVLSAIASDGALASGAATLTLRVNAVPQVNTDASTGYSLSVATSETAYSFTLFSGLFSDVDGDALTWSVSGLPDGLSFDPATRVISGSATEVGVFTLTVTGADASGASASLTLELTVEQIANRAPEVNAQADTLLDTFTEGEAGSVALDSGLFIDADSLYGDSLAWRVDGLPDGLSFDAETLTISGTAADAGAYTISVTVVDESGKTAAAEVTLRVITQDEADNGAPALDADASSLVYTADGGLSGYGYAVQDLTLSADDGTLIVVGNTSLAHAVTAGGTAYITIYSRDATTGALTLIQTLVQGTTDDGDAANGVEVDGLANATAVTYSADGSQVYIAGRNQAGDYVITTFNVNADGTLSASGLSTVVGAQVKAITLSSDGSALYVVSASTLYSFTVGDDGALALAGSYAAASGNTYGVAVDSRGYVYVSSGTYLMVFSAGEDGALTQLVSTSGLSLSTFVRTLAVTDDGYIFLATGTGGTVVTVYFDSENSTLTKVASVSAGTQVWGLNLSADGTTLYVGTNTGNLLVYRINDDGSLALSTTVTGIGARAYRITVSSDGSSIYAGGFFTAGGLGIVSASDIVAVSYTEGETITVASALTLSDAEYDALNDGAGNYNGATITLVRDGGANAADSYGFADGNGLTYSDGGIYLDGAVIATLVSADGALAVAFTADVTTATANRVLQQLTYTNTSSDPGSSITLVVSVSDRYTASSVNVRLSVAVINNAPSLEAAGQDATYISGGSAVKVFDNVTLSAGEDEQSISGLTLTVSGLEDGEKEILIVGGSYVTLTDGASVSGSVSADVVESDGSISTYSYFVSISVSVTDGVATVTVSSGDGLPADLAAVLVKDIAYINTSADYSEDPTTGDRTITLTAVQDNGGTDNGGVDTTALAISATVTVGLTNSAPSVTASGASANYIENGDGVTLFSDVDVSTGEPGQTIGNIALTVSGLADGESETLVIDGAQVSLTAEASGETANGYSYYVSLDGDTATVYLYISNGISANAASELIAGLTYANASDDPTAGIRTITLISLQDGGGTANGGADTVTLAIAAHVTVTAVNDAPTLTAAAADVSYASSGSSVSLFSDVAISTVESGQTLSSIVFTVAGLLDGAGETLIVAGVSIALADGSGALDNGYAYAVTLNGDVATVTLSGNDGIAAADAAALIEQTRYANLSSAQTAGVRTVGLSVRDSGGVENGGGDAAALESAASISVVNNSAPELSAGADYTSLETATSLTAISGLSDITASALTAAGDYLYVVSGDGGIAIFSRSTDSGELTLLQTLESGVSSVSLIEMSEDGGTLYLLGAGGNSVAIFSRDGGDGSLTLVQTLATENAVDLTASADGGALYVVDGTYSGLLVYTLDGGQYALSQSIAASTSSEPYLFSAIGVETAGDYVYVITDPAADTLANTLIVYQRAADGTLSAVAWLRDGASAGESTVDISSPVGLAVSSDGGTIYVASEDGVAAFGFDVDSGTLTYLGAISGLSNVTDLALSDGGGTLYVTLSDGGVSRYKSEDGALTLLETLSSASTAALAGAQSVATGAYGAVVVTGDGGLVSLKDALTEIAIDYTEQGTVLPAGLITLGDADYDALADGAGNYNGATISIARGGGANGDDSYGFADGDGLTLADGTIYLDGAAIATFADDDGALTVTFTADVTTAVANRVLRQISYSNVSDDPGASIRLSVTVTDVYSASASATLALNVAEVNDAPVSTSTPADASYAEGDAAVRLFSDSAVSTVEAGQAIASLTLSVSGLSDGASETLTIDGAAVPLVAGSGATAGGYAYSVSVSGGDATVVISSASGISAADAAALI
ncbi:beta-propeller fold lactonase family protein, partial [Brenneria populi]|nr:beta-propeller fold lactonase family protein [Brenneria populi Li et al. 2015]